jgi:hypothetical protein
VSDSARNAPTHAQGPGALLRATRQPHPPSELPGAVGAVDTGEILELAPGVGAVGAAVKAAEFVAAAEGGGATGPTDCVALAAGGWLDGSVVPVAAALALGATMLVLGAAGPEAVGIALGALLVDAVGAVGAAPASLSGPLPASGGSLFPLSSSIGFTPADPVASSAVRDNTA